MVPVLIKRYLGLTSLRAVPEQAPGERGTAEAEGQLSDNAEESDSGRSAPRRENTKPPAP